MVEQAIGSSETLALLREHKPVLRERFGVVELALFGSTVRDEARTDSDVDILVSFDGRADSRRYFGVWFYIEDLLGRPVDLAVEGSIRSELRPYVEAEAVRV
ncbi:MAG: nucleotidyltransferase family protein [Chloroflexi bacterium]|nr:nucleotidyltransferase family protein [Chloroflexota bacterium]